MIRSARLVIGVGFGDEGKGLMTDYFAQEHGSSCVVVRFNGGCQAGHTVDTGSHRHVFSHFGSGTFRGASTFWSKLCPLAPLALQVEREALQRKLGKDPMPLLYIDPLCPVTTYWDMWANQTQEQKNQHGSCGVGFGTTIGRHETTPHKLHAIDLLNEDLTRWKLDQIRSFYGGVKDTAKDDRFIEVVAGLKLKDRLCDAQMALDGSHLIFEGAQGILLDQDHGFFPNVTRSYCTARNAMKLLKKLKWRDDPHVTYVSRSYSTRHGNGPFLVTGPVSLKKNEGETNQTNPWQGEFRTGLLNEALVAQAIEINRAYCNADHEGLAMTCMDQHEFRWSASPLRHSINLTHTSRGPTADHVRGC